MLITAGGAAHAASILAVPDATTIGVGDSSTVSLLIALEPGEEAVLFEGTFSLSGPGEFGADPTVFGASWTISFGLVQPGNTSVKLSLQGAENSGDHSLLAEVFVLGLQPGTIEIVLESGAFAERDLPVFPFVERLSLTPSSGSLSATITVVPEPGTALLVGLGVAAMAARSRFAARSVATAR